MCFICFQNIEVGTILRSLLPISTREYWYFTAYFMVLLMRPLLNYLINNMPIKALVGTLSICVIVFSIQGMFFDVYGLSGGHSTIWLIVLYMIGGVLAKCDDCIMIVTLLKKYSGFIFAGSTFVTFISFIIIDTVQYIPRFFEGVNGGTALFNLVSPTILMCALASLFGASKIKASQMFTRLVAFFAPNVFAAYLIHINYAIFENYWENGFTWIAKLPLVSMPLVVIGISFLIVLLSCIVDYVRVFIFKKIKVEQVSLAVEKLVDSCMEKLSRMCL
jgi:hypothetical protein